MIRVAKTKAMKAKSEGGYEISFKQRNKVNLL